MIVFYAKKVPLLSIDAQNGPLTNCPWHITEAIPQPICLDPEGGGSMTLRSFWIHLQPTRWQNTEGHGLITNKSAYRLAKKQKKVYLFTKFSYCSNWSIYRAIFWLKFEMLDSVAHPLFYHKNSPKGDCLGKGKCIFTLSSLMQQSRTDGGFIFNTSICLYYMWHITILLKQLRNPMSYFI